MPAPFFWATTARWHWATTWPARRTCCPPAARPDLPADLSAHDFLRSNSVLHFSREGLTALAADVRVMADKEGLTAHRASVEMRAAESGEPPASLSGPS